MHCVEFGFLQLLSVFVSSCRFCFRFLLHNVCVRAEWWQKSTIYSRACHGVNNNSSVVWLVLRLELHLPPFIGRATAPTTPLPAGVVPGVALHARAPTTSVVVALLVAGPLLPLPRVPVAARPSVGPAATAWVDYLQLGGISPVLLGRFTTNNK